MPAATVGPDDIAAVFDGMRNSFDLKAVAFGAKSKDGVTDLERPVLTFFVPEKLPLAADRSRLADGSPALPRQIAVGTGTIETDVVAIAPDTGTAAGVITGAPLYVPGGKIAGDNGAGMGTMTCLVRSNATGRPMALTNRHIAPVVGGFAYFYRNTQWFLRRPVLRTVEDASFGQFVSFAGPAAQAIRVDASLIDLDPQLLPKFSNELPPFGKLGPPFAADLSNAQAYFDSVKGRRVASYGWKTKQRFGEITNVFGALLSSGGTTIVGCLFIKGLNGTPPSIAGDSGKLWLTDGAQPNMPIGLNIGTTFDPSIAVATDFGALARFLDFTVL